MIYNVQVLDVIGDCHEFATQDIERARVFLESHDHEGAEVMVKVQADNERAYLLLWPDKGQVKR